MSTNTKAVIEANKRHILKLAGGKRAFLESVRGAGGIRNFVRGGGLLAYTDDMRKYLMRVIPKADAARLRSADVVDRTYFGIMIRDGEKLLREIKRDHPNWRCKRHVK